MPAADRVLARLLELGHTVAVAESLTGGLVLAALVAVPGASGALRGGVVAYAADVKERMLGVDAALLAAHSAVHPDIARQMAEGVRTALRGRGTPADVGIATTGVAGPGPDAGIPAGTVHVAVSTATETRVESFVLSGDRSVVRVGATRRALELAAAVLGRECPSADDGSDR